MLERKARYKPIKAKKPITANAPWPMLSNTSTRESPAGFDGNGVTVAVTVGRAVVAGGGVMTGAEVDCGTGVTVGGMGVGVSVSTSE